jgi:hypothetical protein
METTAPIKLWISLGTIGFALGTVSTFTIQAGPSASNAMIAIRVAHLELFWAKIAFRDPPVHEAESHLNEAWSTLRDRRYQQSVVAASKALVKVRDLKGGMPWLHSGQRDKARSEPNSAPES